MTLKLKRDSKKYNKAPGSHGTHLRDAPKSSPNQWLAKMNRKFRYLVEWDIVQREWAPKKMTMSHALQIAEEQAVELMARPDAAILRDAQERAQNLVDQLQGTRSTTVPPNPIPVSGLMLGGRGKSADELRQKRRTDNGI